MDLFSSVSTLTPLVSTDGVLSFFYLYIDDFQIYTCMLDLFPERPLNANLIYSLGCLMGISNLTHPPNSLSPPIPSVCTFSWNDKPFLRGAKVQDLTVTFNSSLLLTSPSHLWANHLSLSFFITSKAITLEQATFISQLDDSISPP